MPVLILKFNDKIIKEYPIIIGESVTIGRKEANDIVIDNLAVSGFHAQVDSVSSNFVLRDLESTNGTFVNSEKKDIHNFRHNDVVMIGKHELVFDSSDLEKMKSGPGDQFSDDKTRILETDKYREMAGKPKPEPKAKTNKTAVAEEQQDDRSAVSKFFGKIFG